MKKIIAAWIEQILEFDGKLEYLAYIEDLKQKGQRFEETSYEQMGVRRCENQDQETV